MDFNNLTIREMIIMGLMSAFASLLMGKFLKKILVMIVQPVISKTKWKGDDELLETAKEDWNITDEKQKD